MTHSELIITIKELLVKKGYPQDTTSIRRPINDLSRGWFVQVISLQNLEKLTEAEALKLINAIKRAPSKKRLEEMELNMSIGMEKREALLNWAKDNGVVVRSNATTATIEDQISKAGLVIPKKLAIDDIEDEDDEFITKWSARDSERNRDA